MSSGAAALALFIVAPTAFAETTAVIPTSPPTVVGGGGANPKPIAVDSVWHIVYTINTSNQIQATYYNGSAWQTGALGAGVAAGSGSLLYVDTGYHIVFYMNSNGLIFAWYWNGSAWVNSQLTSIISGNTVNLLGVDSNSHIVWFVDGQNLSALYFNGSTWVIAPSGITDCASNDGGVVDDTTHSLYWNDAGNTRLRRLVWTGRDFASSTLPLDTNAFTGIRPAVHPGTGEVYSADNTTTRLFRYVPGFHFTRQDVGPSGEQASIGTGLAINPLNGKVIYCRYTGGITEVAVVTPNAGNSSTWPRTTVPGTSGQQVLCCAMDNGRGYYFYTTGIGDNSLHVVY